MSVSANSTEYKAYYSTAKMHTTQTSRQVNPCLLFDAPPLHWQEAWHAFVLASLAQPFARAPPLAFQTTGSKNAWSCGDHAGCAKRLRVCANVPMHACANTTVSVVQYSSGQSVYMHCEFNNWLDCAKKTYSICAKVSRVDPAMLRTTAVYFAKAAGSSRRTSTSSEVLR